MLRNFNIFLNILLEIRIGPIVTTMTYYIHYWYQSWTIIINLQKCEKLFCWISHQRFIKSQIRNVAMCWNVVSCHYFKIINWLSKKLKNRRGWVGKSYGRIWVNRCNHYNMSTFFFRLRRLDSVRMQIWLHSFLLLLLFFFFWGIHVLQTQGRFLFFSGHWIQSSSLSKSGK